MEAPATGAVVLVRFPFSDLSRTKLRPAVVLADAGRGDRVLCQVTSKPYGDSAAVVLDDTAFASGSPRETSYARPGKLFTASSDLMMGQVGLRTPEARTRIVDAELALMRTDSPTASESNLGPDGKRLLARDIQTLHLNSARAMRLVSSGRGISPLSQTGPWAAHPALRDIRVSEINRLNRWPSTAAIPAQVSTPQDR